MKRLLVAIMICSLVSGCTGANINVRDERPAFPINIEIGGRIMTAVNNEMGTTAKLYIYHGENINAFTDGKDVFVHEDLFKMSEEALTFVVAHEAAHVKLGHVQSKQAIGVGITTGMLVLDAFIPGVGLLNLLINPLIVQAFSREQEFAADKLASETCTKLGIGIEDQLYFFEHSTGSVGGGLWDAHPSIEDRIANIKS